MAKIHQVAFFLFILPTAIFLLSGCGKAEKEHEVPFKIEGSNSVPFELFNVLTPGTIRVEVSWAGESENLSVVLSGRRRPDREDPTEPYGEATGPSPLTITYRVTREDLARGVGWRLAIYDEDGSGDAEGMIRIKTPYRSSVDKAFQKEKLSLKSGDHWPGPDLQNQFLEALEATEAEGLHGLISLNRPLTCDEQWYFEQEGLIRQSFLPRRNSFGFIRKGADLANPSIAEPLRAIMPLEPEDKIDPHILLGNFNYFLVKPSYEPLKNYVLNEDGTLEVSVLFAKNITPSRVHAILAEEAITYAETGGFIRLATLNADRLTRLAAYDEIEWIGPGPLPYIAANDTTRMVLQVDGVQQPETDPVTGDLILSVEGYPNYIGLSGQGISVGVDEGGGIDREHDDFWRMIDGEKVYRIIDVNPATGNGSHGTKVAGIIASSGLQSDSQNPPGALPGDPSYHPPFQYRGMAPNAVIINDHDLLNLDNLIRGIQDYSLDLSNHSRHVSINGIYNVEDHNADLAIRGGRTPDSEIFPRRPHILAAGNNGGNSPQPGVGNELVGYFSLITQSKNTLVIGNWNYHDNALQAGSSLGPAHDGRIKPDLIAPGHRVMAPKIISGQDWYDLGYGTSMAAPAVSGVVALMLEAWQNTYSAFGGTSFDENPPFPSTLKAILIQTAQDVVDNDVRNGYTCQEIDALDDLNDGTWGTGLVEATLGPDFATGWGIVNALEAVELLQDTRTVDGVPIPNRIIQDAACQGTVNEYDFVIQGPGSLKVTLAWDDPESSTASPATDPLLVNDLDLELVAPDGEVFYPWLLGQKTLDDERNLLANDAQLPGTPITIELPIVPTATTLTERDYIPNSAFTDHEKWLARGNDALDPVQRGGKDHLNNVEQVFIPNVQPDQVGHWKARVIGFDVESGAQDYSLVGFPYPDLAELVVSCNERVPLAIGEVIEFDWAVTNTGEMGTGESFNYRILLSKDLYPDDEDIELEDETYSPIGSLEAGVTTEPPISSTVQILQRHAKQLLGRTEEDPDVTVEELANEGVFLIIQADHEDQILEHNELNIAFVQLALPVDVVLVLDRSGSMDGEVPVSTGNRLKIELLQSSANLFLDLMRREGEDRLSQVSFSGGERGSITIDFGPTEAEDFPVGLVEATDDNVEEARGALALLTPGNRTDIHRALELGLEVLTTVGAPNPRRVLIFFSDGEKTAGGDPSEEAFLQQFEDEDIQIYSIGFGTPGALGYSSIDIDLLQTLANTGDQGFFHVTQDALGLDKFFVNAVAGATETEVILDPIGNIGPNETQRADIPITDQDLRTTFVLTWDDPAVALGLSLASPGGLIINTENVGLFADRINIRPGPTYRLMEVHWPIISGPSTEQEGAWQMLIHNPSGSRVRYAASALGESTIHMDLMPALPSGLSTYPTGSPIPFQANIRGNHSAPISTARVSVTPTVPLVSTGDLLSAAGIDEERLAESLDKGEDPYSFQEAMMLALVDLLGGGNPLPREEKAPFKLVLEEDPGAFSGNLSETAIEGVYSFLVTAEGSINCQRFQRETSFSLTVSPAAEEPIPLIIDTDPEEPGEVTVRITPISTTGSFFGPGYSSDLRIDAGNNVNALSGIIDHLDGSYSQQFGLSNTGVTEIYVQFRGVSAHPIRLDTRLPTPVGTNPRSGRNDTEQTIRVSFGPNAAISRITGFSLVNGKKAIRLPKIQVEQDGRTIQAVVPPELPPDLYQLYPESSDGSGLSTANVTYRVTGLGENYPESVAGLVKGLEALLNASTDYEGFSQLGILLRNLRKTPIGYNYTEPVRIAAVREAVGLLKAGKGRVTRTEVNAISTALEMSKRDARGER